jgi:hypothetical protein
LNVLGTRFIGKSNASCYTLACTQESSRRPKMLKFSNYQQRSLSDHIYVSSYSYSSSDESDLSNDDTPKNSFLYDLVTNGDNQYQLTLDPFWCIPPSLDPRVLLVVGVFTVECNSCSKWRLIPTKKKYEEIHEHILQTSSVCNKAWELQHDISCDDKEDFSKEIISSGSSQDISCHHSRALSQTRGF